jgi:hypothetical protein
MATEGERQENRQAAMRASARQVTPNQSTGPRYVFIVSRFDPALFEYLREHFADAAEVQVILDRRRAERRRHALTVTPERRRADRRTRPEIDRRLASESHVFLTLV